MKLRLVLLLSYGISFFASKAQTNIPFNSYGIKDKSYALELAYSIGIANNYAVVMGQKTGGWWLHSYQLGNGKMTTPKTALPNWEIDGQKVTLRLGDLIVFQDKLYGIYEEKDKETKTYSVKYAQIDPGTFTITKKGIITSGLSAKEVRIHKLCLSQDGKSLGLAVGAYEAKTAAAGVIYPFRLNSNMEVVWKGTSPVNIGFIIGISPVIDNNNHFAYIMCYNGYKQKDYSYYLYRMYDFANAAEKPVETELTSAKGQIQHANPVFDSKGMLYAVGTYPDAGLQYVGGAFLASFPAGKGMQMLTWEASGNELAFLKTWQEARSGGSEWNLSFPVASADGEVAFTLEKRTNLLLPHTRELLMVYTGNEKGLKLSHLEAKGTYSFFDAIPFYVGNQLYVLVNKEAASIGKPSTYNYEVVEYENMAASVIRIGSKGKTGENDVTVEGYKIWGCHAMYNPARKAVLITGDHGEVQQTMGNGNTVELSIGVIEFADTPVPASDSQH